MAQEPPASDRSEAPERGAVRVVRLPADDGPASDREVELAMPSHDRRRVRRRVVAPDGLTIELALPTGTILEVGALLCRRDGVAYRVAAAPERLLEIRPRTTEEGARVGHLIGNLHRDIDVEDGRVLALWDAPLERRLRAMGLEVRVVDRPFRGRPPSEHAHG
jgi:urease accessory protein